MGLVRHLGHYGRDRPAQVLQHVKAMALSLDQLCVGVRTTKVRLTSEAPGAENPFAHPTTVDDRLCTTHRLGVAMVEVDCEEDASLLRLRQQLVGFGEVEGEWLFDQH